MSAPLEEEIERARRGEALISAWAEILYHDDHMSREEIERFCEVARSANDLLMASYTRVRESIASRRHPQ